MSVIRRVGILFAAVLTACVASACTFQVRAANGVDGKDVQRKIDETIAPMLRDHFPKLLIAPAVCADDVFPQTNGTMGYCTLSVNGVPLRIRVASADPPEYFKVDFGGAYFFETSQIDAMAARIVRSNASGHPSVHCGGPPVRLLQPGQKLTCDVEGMANVKSMQLKAMENGNLFFYNQPGVKVPGAVPDVLYSLHKRGDHTIASGQDVRRFIQSIYATAEGRQFGVQCPAKMDLTGTKTGICTLEVPGTNLHQRLGVWIDDANGIRVRPIDVVLDRQRLANAARDDFNRKLSDSGAPADAVVSCGQGKMVVRWPAAFDCKMTAGHQRYTVTVTVQDFKGDVTWKAVPIPKGANR